MIVSFKSTNIISRINEISNNHRLQIKQNHRTIEKFGLEGTFKGHLVQPPAMSRDIFTQTRLLRAPSNLTFNVSRDGASTTFLGNLFQYFTTLQQKIFFLISSLNLTTFSLKPLPCVLSLQVLLKSLASCSLYAPFKYQKGAIRCLRSLLFSSLNDLKKGH